MTIKLAGLFLLLGAGTAEAQKDSVWIRNGDRITGEVKSLSRGLLKYSTDDLGTIYIEWDKVDRISTSTVVEVRLITGHKFYGRLGLAPTGLLALAADTLRTLRHRGNDADPGEIPGSAEWLFRPRLLLPESAWRSSAFDRSPSAVPGSERGDHPRSHGLHRGSG